MLALGAGDKEYTVVTEIDRVTSSRKSTVQRGESNIKHNHAGERVNKSCDRFYRKNKKRMSPDLGRAVKKDFPKVDTKVATGEANGKDQGEGISEKKGTPVFSRVGQEYGLR